MIKKGIIVTLIFIFSTFVQLISQIIVTRIFGAKLDLDIFLAAVAIPTILVTVIYGTLNSAFLPLYGRIKTKNPKNSDSYFISMVIFLGILSLVTAWICGFVSRPLSQALYGSRGDEFVKNVAVQMNFMFYSIPLSIIATLFGAYYYLHKHFNRFPVAQALGSVANLFIIVLSAPYIGIWSLVIAFVVNILFQIIFIIPRISFSFNFMNFKNFINLTNLFIAWIPLVIGNIALRSDSLLIRSFGSSLPVGYLVYLNLISKIFNLATGMMTIGIQVIILPHLVEYFNEKKYDKAINSIYRSKIISILVSVFVTIAVIIMAPIFIYILFVGNKFTKHDADLTISLLPYFILPSIGWGINGVYFQPLNALNKQLQIGLINVFALIAAIAVGTIILPLTGSLNAISTSLIILLGTGIIGSEILWQIEKKKLLTKSQSSLAPSTDH